LFKYVNKGSNIATIKITNPYAKFNKETNIDEIKRYMIVDIYHQAKQLGEYLVLTSTTDDLPFKY